MRSLFFLIVIIIKISGLTAQNFSKNYYILDDIDAGFKVFVVKEDYLIEYFATKKIKMDDGNYYTRYIGYLRTDKNGDLISKINHEGILGYSDLIDEKYIYCSGFEGWGLYKINNCKVLKTDNFGNTLKINTILFKDGDHKILDSKYFNSNIYASDMNQYSGDSFKDKIFTNDTFQIHKFDTSLVYQKTIVCPYIQPLSRRLSTVVHDDNFFVCAVSIQDTSLKYKGQVKYSAIAFDSLGKQKWVYHTTPIEGLFDKEFISTFGFQDKSTAILFAYQSDLEIFTNQEIVKLNSKGKKLWSFNDVNDQNWYIDYSFSSIFKAKNDDIIAVGTCYGAHVDTTDRRTGIIMRISNDGKLKWKRRVWDDRAAFHHSGFNNGVELEDGSLLITGWWRDSLGLPPIYDTNVWLIKLDSMGCYTPGCTGDDFVTSTDNVIVIGRDMLKLSPNPANQFIKCTWSGLPSTAKLIKLYDLNGRELMQSKIEGKSGNTELNISSLTQGIYLVKIYGDKWETAPEKFVKE